MFDGDHNDAEKVKQLINGELNEEALSILFPIDKISTLRAYAMRSLYQNLSGLGQRAYAETLIAAWLPGKELEPLEAEIIAKRQDDPNAGLYSDDYLRKAIREAATEFHPALKAKGITAAQQKMLDQAYSETKDGAPETLAHDFEKFNAGEDDNSSLPPRQWLLGIQFCRGTISGLVADGGVGKSALRLAQAISIAIGKPLTGEKVFERARVLYLSLEDGRDEMRRRIEAVKRYHKVTNEELKGWFYYATPDNLYLANVTENGRPKRGNMLGVLNDVCREFHPALIVIDPFVGAHRLEENSNNIMDFLMKKLARGAVGMNVAIDIVHHSAKGLGLPGDANRARGASSIRDALRLMHTLTPMTKEEAGRFGLNEDERRSLVRLDPAKVNIARPAAEAQWFRLVGVRLDNPDANHPSGDTVQTVEPWMPPEGARELSDATVKSILDQLEEGLPEGQRYSRHGQSDRAAWRVLVEACSSALSDARAKEIVKVWLKEGILVEREYADAKSRKKMGLFVAKRPDDEGF